MSKSTKIIAALGVVAGLGVAAMPLSSYAAQAVDAQGYSTANTNVGITMTIEDKISIAVKSGSASTVALTEGALTGDTTVNVVSNNSKGYHLAIKGTTDTTKGNAVTDLVNKAGDKIPALSAAYGASTIKAFTASTSNWGYRVATSQSNIDATDATKATLDAFTADTTKYAGVTDTDANIVDTTKPTNKDGADTTITFGVNLADDLSTPAGVYEGQVTLTATNNAKPNEA